MTERETRAEALSDELAEAVRELWKSVEAQRERNRNVYDVVRAIETRVANLGASVEQLHRQLDEMRSVVAQQCRLSDLREERRREVAAMPQTSADSITPRDLFTAIITGAMWTAHGAYGDQPIREWRAVARKVADQLMEDRRCDDAAR
jgi:chromosome segregation ATPase